MHIVFRDFQHPVSPFLLYSLLEDGTIQNPTIEIYGTSADSQTPYTLTLLRPFVSRIKSVHYISGLQEPTHYDVYISYRKEYNQTHVIVRLISGKEYTYKYPDVCAPERQDLCSHPIVYRNEKGSVLEDVCNAFLTQTYITLPEIISVVPIDRLAQSIVRSICSDDPRDTEFSGVEIDSKLVLDHLRAAYSLKLQWIPSTTLLSPSCIPKMTVQLCKSDTIQFYIQQSTEYAVRMYQDVQFRQFAPISLSDRFWYRIGSHELVNACLTLRTPVPVSEWETYKWRIWSAMMSMRKCTTRIDTLNWCWKPEYADINEYFTILESNQTRLHSILEKAYPTKPNQVWHMSVIVDSENQTITHVLAQFQHALMDGKGTLPLLQQFKKIVFEEHDASDVKRIPTRRSLPLWLDVWMGILYIGLLLLILTEKDTPLNQNYSQTPTVAVQSGLDFSNSKQTYTTELLRRVVNALKDTTGQDSHIVSVPAGFAFSYNPSAIVTNDFVPILLPLRASMTESEFSGRCAFLRSKSVAFLSWCIQRLLEWGELDQLRDANMNKISATVTSLQTDPYVSKSIDSIHILTTSPAPIPFCVAALTTHGTTHLTIRSHHPTVDAERLLKTIQDIS
jgi:hypothetical protein